MGGVFVFTGRLLKSLSSCMRPVNTMQVLNTLPIV
mgnify:CR=1 FL=1